MPRKYQRKVNVIPRASWSEQQLREAIQKVESGEISEREAHRRYNVPPRTLKRRMKTGNFQKGRLGPDGILGKDNEKKLVLYIQRLSAAGLTPDRNTVRKLAYQFAEELKIKHKFSGNTEMAGFTWLQSFLDRNPEISIRQAETLSLPKTRSINMEEIIWFFELLERETVDHTLIERLENSVQLNLNVIAQHLLLMIGLLNTEDSELCTESQIIRSITSIPDVNKIEAKVGEECNV